MRRHLSYSVSLLILLTTGMPIHASTAGVSQGETRNLNVHGLDHIALDSWTNLLLKGQAEGVLVEQLPSELSKVLLSVKNEQQVFKQIKDVIKSVKLHTADDYYRLGQMLMELRQDLRQRTGMKLKVRQDSLFLLQLMAEESLYIGSKKFANFPKEISFEDKALSSGKTTKLRNFSVQTGDVVLSKSTGFGSSSFIALTMDHPHIYSHSTPIYIDHKGEVLSPEAEIEDGVKLRSMIKDYVDGSKTRMFIYRYQGSDPGVPEKIEAGMQNLVSEMYQRTGGDPFNKPAFIYDFSMTPGDAATRGLFCSSVAYEAYKRGGLTGSANPYDPQVWSPINKGREILLKSLNMNTERVPAPGDLELNKDFRLVGARVDVTKLHQDRVEMAIIDTFLAEMENNKETMTRIAKALEAIDSRPIDKKSLMAMANSGLLPKEFADKAAMIEKIPDSISLKQMAFFAFLNEVMTPKIRTTLLTQLTEMEKQGRLVGPQELRKMARTQQAGMMKELSAFEQKIITAIGVQLCGKVL